MPAYAPCPKCCESGAKPVTFTWWGGLLGPKLFNHVRCDYCNTTFNGKTGRLNTAAIATYLVVTTAIAIALVTYLFFFSGLSLSNR